MRRYMVAAAALALCTSASSGCSRHGAGTGTLQEYERAEADYLSGRISEEAYLVRISGEIQKGHLTDEEGRRRASGARSRVNERAYREGRIGKEEYVRRKATLFMNEMYYTLSTSGDEDHLGRLLEVVDGSSFQVAGLMLYRYDGIVTVSIDRDQIGNTIRSVDDHVRLDREGLLKESGESGPDDGGAGMSAKKGNFGMIRPVFNRERCQGCHRTDQKVLGGLYVVIDVQGLD